MKYLFPNGKTKAVTLSYDDGQKADLRLVSIFNQYNLKATFHLNSSRSLDWFSKEELLNTYKGHEIACHGVEHKFLTEISSHAAMIETANDKRVLEDTFGVPVRGMSYAFGAYNENVKNTLKACGIKYSRTVNATHDFRVPADFLEWHPTCHHNDSLMDLTDKFLNGMIFNDLPVFYVWGHSFEFEYQNNWEHMEAFAKKISGHEEIWYATNIEIFDYTTAIRSLEFWADGNGVYNPSALTVWVSHKNKTYEIPPRTPMLLK